MTRLLPKLAGYANGIDAGPRPPSSLVACAMSFPVMPPTKWNGELLAYLPTEGAGLHETKVMGIRRLPATDETGAGARPP